MRNLWKRFNSPHRIRIDVAPDDDGRRVALRVWRGQLQMIDVPLEPFEAKLIAAALLEGAGAAPIELQAFQPNDEEHRHGRS